MTFGPKSSFVSVDNFRRRAHETMVEFGEEVRELQQLMERDDQTYHPSTTPTHTHARPYTRAPMSSSSSIDSISSTGVVTDTLDTLRSIDANRRVRFEQRQRLEHQHTQRNEPPPNQYEEEFARRIQPAPHERYADSDRSANHLQRFIDEPTKQRDRDTTYRTRPTWSLRKPDASRTPMIHDPAPRRARTPPRPTPLIASPPQSTKSTSSTDPSRRVITSPRTAPPTTTPTRPSTVHDIPKWRQLYIHAETHGWTIRPDRHGTEEASKEADEKRRQLKKHAAMVWPFLTPPPKRVDYDTIARRSAYSAAVAEDAALGEIRQRATSTSPARSDKSMRTSTIPSPPFRFNEDTPMPQRPKSSAKLQKSDIDREIERLGIKQYQSTPVASNPPPLSDADPSVADVGDGSVSPSSLAAAVAAERAHWVAQLDFERQSWRDEKRLIWQHYETDIKALMTREDFEELNQQPTHDNTDSNTQAIDRARSPSPSRPTTQRATPTTSTPSTISSPSPQSTRHIGEEFSPVTRQTAGSVSPLWSDSSSSRLSSSRSSDRIGGDIEWTPNRLTIGGGVGGNPARLETQLNRLNLLLPNSPNGMSQRQRQQLTSMPP